MDVDTDSFCQKNGLLVLPSGKRLHDYGKSTLSMGKSTTSMAMFNSYVCLPEGNMFCPPIPLHLWDQTCPRQ